MENSKKALEQLDVDNQSKKNGNPWGNDVQQVGQYQVGANTTSLINVAYILRRYQYG